MGAKRYQASGQYNRAADTPANPWFVQYAITILLVADIFHDPLFLTNLAGLLDPGGRPPGVALLTGLKAGAIQTG
jgi:hypothetical protein